MAEYVVVDKERLESDLTDIAESIRAKSRTEEKLDFPEGFISAVDSINNVGIILSGFRHLKEDGSVISNDYPLPTVADMRSLPYNYSANWNYSSMFNYVFWNYSRAMTNGYYTELHTVYLPDWITGFGRYMFWNCGNLVNLIGDLSNVIRVYNQAFGGCTSLSEFPYMPNLTRIDNQAFKMCTALTKIVLPPKLSHFEQNVFWYCTGLKVVTFQCIPTNFPSSVFNECTNITTVNLVEGWNKSLYLQFSINLTQECLHDCIEKFADMSMSDITMVFHIGTANIEKIDAEHIAMLDAKCISYS